MPRKEVSRIIWLGRSDRMELYFDCEFDAVRDGDRHQQCVVSIGAVSAQTQEEFYALIRPKNFKRVSRIVASMTQLSDEEVKKAPSFASVMKQFSAWAQIDKEPAILYSFGPDDKRTILEHGVYEQVFDLPVLSQVIDLQKLLSRTILYQGKVVSPTLSLDDLKYVYEIEGDVVHNALNDAIDLMHIHKAYQAGKKPSEKRIQEIVERKIAKQLESKRKQEERMFKIIKERYERMDKQVYTIPLYPAVRELLSFLEEQEHTFAIRFLKQGMVYQGETYPYDKESITMIWYVLDERPHLGVRLSAFDLDVEVPLTYRNANIYESITKCRFKKRIEQPDYKNPEILLKAYEPYMLEDMMALYYDTIHTINSKDYTQEQLDAWAPVEYNKEGMQARFSSSMTITAWKQNRLAGFANLTGPGILDCLYVHKDEQLEHIGAMLVQALENEAKRKGLARIETQASITAKPFFEKLGYTKIRRNHVKRKKQTLMNFTMRKSL